ncbi:hypothetical protein BRADI_2g10590v3 [Brachypodium distachyon]|uniref:PIR2-like helical domain-containing protein n=1 Tax=Brachypodium distachyon TaxID=15368 RepID=A0A0Q3IDC8_BRADI|nr:hypothetical protein BRADI_2g10590v3 [Brachypodium distachyon]
MCPDNSIESKKQSYVFVSNLATTEVQDEPTFRERCARLAMETTPNTLARFLNAGVSVGLLDPVLNIINGQYPRHFRHRPRPHGVMDKDKVNTKPGEMAKRSLNGWDTLRYLLVADSDLLVAARLIVADRGMMGFSITSLASVPAFQAALRLAAQVSKHPQPQLLLDVWMSLSSQLPQLLSAMQTKPNLVDIQRLLGEIPDLGKAWDLAASRPPYNNIAHMPYQATRALRMALLDTFRVFYLRALARLPRAELRSRYHRSMLKAGYCYGPFDPVSNIIVNTIWYDVMFAAPQPPVLDMIVPSSLTRLESRSFCGLASFLQSRYNNLSEHEVVQCLVANCAHLSLADPNFDAATEGVDHQPFADLSISAAASSAAKMEAERQRQQCRTSTPGLYDAIRKVEKQRPCTTPEEAYEAAATAAWHPNPEEHAVFLSSTKEILKGPALLLLQNGEQLTSENVQFIASLLSSQQKPTPEEFRKKNPYPVIAGKKRSEAQQRRISTKRRVLVPVTARLYSNPQGLTELQLMDVGLLIGMAAMHGCGRKPDRKRGEEVDEIPAARRRGVGYGGVLHGQGFTVRVRGGGQGEEQGYARGSPSPPYIGEEADGKAEHVRCLYCEADGTKIVHPASGKFHGREGVFEEAICKDHSDKIICKNEYAVQRVYAVD